jgi:hypothetical protein
MEIDGPVIRRGFGRCNGAAGHGFGNLGALAVFLAAVVQVHGDHDLLSISIALLQHSSEQTA